MSEELTPTVDPALSAEERETIIRIEKAESQLAVFSEEPVVMRWLLRNPEYTETDRRTADTAQYATQGTLPIGALLLQGHSRSSQHLSPCLGEVPDDA